MSITTFADQLQLDLGALTADTDVSNWLSGWAAREGTQASNNPLACTIPMPGSTYFNCLKGCSNGAPCPTCTWGVQNYLTERDGAQATALNLKEVGHGYEPLVSAIALHDKAALGIYGSPSQGVIDALNHWCGCGYGAQAGSFSGGGSVNGNISNSPDASCSAFACGCYGATGTADKSHTIGCFWCLATNGLDSTKCFGGATVPGTPKNNSPFPPWLLNVVGNGNNLLKFILGLGVFAVGLGLVFEILSQQPVIAPAISGAKKLAGAALL